MQGLDPIEERRKAEADQKLEQGRDVTFDDAVDANIEANKAAWGNEKHVKQWKSTLTTYATPRMGKLPVGEVETGPVLAVLEPIWTAKTETATPVPEREHLLASHAQLSALKLFQGFSSFASQVVGIDQEVKDQDLATLQHAVGAIDDVRTLSDYMSLHGQISAKYERALKD